MNGSEFDRPRKVLLIDATPMTRIGLATYLFASFIIGTYFHLVILRFLTRNNRVEGGVNLMILADILVEFGTGYTTCVFIGVLVGPRPFGNLISPWGCCVFEYISVFTGMYQSFSGLGIALFRICLIFGRTLKVRFDVQNLARFVIGASFILGGVWTIGYKIFPANQQDMLYTSCMGKNHLTPWTELDYIWKSQLVKRIVLGTLFAMNTLEMLLYVTIYIYLWKVNERTRNLNLLSLDRIKRRFHRTTITLQVNGAICFTKNLMLLVFLIPLVMYGSAIHFNMSELFIVLSLSSWYALHPIVIIINCPPLLKALRAIWHVD